MAVLDAALLRFSRWAQGVVERDSPPVVLGPLPTHGRPWIERLEGSWTDIRDEYLALLASGLSIPPLADQLGSERDDAARRANDRGAWRAYVLNVAGRPIHRNLRRVPKTAALLDDIPGLGSAMFSVLEPRTHIPRHADRGRGALRYHLGLSVPDPSGACRIDLGDRKATWAEGQSLLFDVSIEHEVWNDTDQERVVLFLEVLPDLPPLASAVNRSLFEIGSRSAQARALDQRISEYSAALE